MVGEKLVVLAAFAHPDDETMLIGGTLAMLAARGARVHVLCATRGEGGELGEPPLCQPHELGRRREAELRCAVQALGCASLEILGYRDPPVDQQGHLHAFNADLDSLATQIRQRMQSVGAGVLITHGSNGEYGHPAHRLMHQAALGAVQTSPTDTAILYTVSATFPGHPRPHLANEDDAAHFVLDVGPWLAAKLTAARCHRTQLALFLRRSSRAWGRPAQLEEVLMRRESLHRAWPAGGDALHDPLARFLQARCADALLPL